MEMWWKKKIGSLKVQQEENVETVEVYARQQLGFYKEKKVNT